ncbi:MAG: hypothetical protein A2096_02605 [Spirochaetes bacterium GWF1_41_5]|nr:MAG: hypothetical protein A2096_02605 [Spirochaetes bacterium GWF1_41_5]
MRPRTKLDIFTASTAGVKSYIEEGIMHIDYSYLKGIDKQGTPGSAIKLRLSTTEPTEQMSFISVLYPQAAGKTNERMKIQFQPEDPGRGRLEIKCDAFTDTVIFYTISDTKFPANRSAIDISRSDGSQVIFNIHLSEKPEKIHD